VTNTEATLQSRAVTTGGGSVSERGLVWGKQASGLPTTASEGRYRIEETGLGEIQTTVSDLDPFTSYIVRAYGINEKGTFYSEPDTLTTLPFAGEGTPSAPFQVSTAKELYFLSQVDTMWNRHYVQTAEIVIPDSFYTAGGLMHDGGEYFRPIGSMSSPFSGHYDGDKYVIRNLQINRSSTDRVGLFGVTDGALIEKVGVVGATIEARHNVGVIVGVMDQNVSGDTLRNSFSDKSTVIGKNGVGGLVGYLHDDAVLLDSYSKASVQGMKEVGGLVGKVMPGQGTSELPKIATSYAAGTVSASNPPEGGVVGFEDDGGSTYQEVFFNTDSLGAVGHGTTDPDPSGLVGISSAQLRDITTFDTTNWNFAGTWALADTNNGYPSLSWTLPFNLDPIQSANVTTTTMDVTSKVMVDGGNIPTEVGFVWGTSSLPTLESSDGSITVTYNGLLNDFSGTITGLTRGEVYSIRSYAINTNGTQYSAPRSVQTVPFATAGTPADKHQIETISHLTYIAKTPSLWGDHFQVNDTLNGSSVSTTPIGTKAQPFTGSFDGQMYPIKNLSISSSEAFAGLFGYVGDSVAIDGVALTSVSVTGTRAVGAIAGYLGQGSTMEESYAQGSVTASGTLAGGLVGRANDADVKHSYARVSVQAVDSVGGLIGDVQSGSTVEYAYASGSVTATGTPGITKGGLFGAKAPTGVNLRELLWDTDITTQAKGWKGGTGKLSGATGYSTEYMTKISTYIAHGWDLSNRWAMQHNYHSGYPFLEKHAHALIDGTNGFRMLSAPVSGAILGDMLSNLWTQGATGSDAPNGTPNVWLFDTDAQEWAAVTDFSSEQVTAGQGVLVYVFEDVDFDRVPDLPLVIRSPRTPDESQEVDFSVPTNGWTFIGNPYGKPISWHSVDKNGRRTASVNASISRWDHRTRRYVSSNAATRSKLGGRRYMMGGGASQDTVSYDKYLSDVIPPFQGFWVNANGSSGQVKIHPQDIEEDSVGLMLKSPSRELNVDHGALRFVLQTFGEEGMDYDYTDITFHERGLFGLDEYDARKLMPIRVREGANIMTQLYNKTMSVSGHATNHGASHSTGQGNGAQEPYSADEIDGLRGAGLSIANVPFNVLPIGGLDNAKQRHFLSLSTLELDTVKTALKGKKAPMTLSWDASGLPSHVNVEVRDNQTGETFNIRDVDEYTFDSHESEGLAYDPSAFMQPYSADPTPRFTIQLLYNGASADWSAGTLPEQFELSQNYPNPFNPTTTIRYALPATSKVRLTVFDILGREVMTLVNSSVQEAGWHEAVFDGRQFASGVYIYRLDAISQDPSQPQRYSMQRRFTLVK
jgi:hypothetical protein